MAHKFTPTLSFNLDGVTSSGAMPEVTADFIQGGHHDTTGDNPLTEAVAATLTTRTGDADGVFTATAHGIAEGAIIDIYWSGGCRYGCTVKDVTPNTPNAIEIETAGGGAGDVLPTEGTACTIGVQLSEICPVTGNNVKAIQIIARTKSSLTLWESGAEAFHVDFPAGGGAAGWTTNIHATNPLAGKTIATARVSCGATVIPADAIAYYLGVDNIA